MFCLLVPYMEIHTTVYEANSLGLPLDELYPGTGKKTFWLSSIGLLAVSLGFRLGLQPIWNKLTPTVDHLKASAENISQFKLLLVLIVINTGGILLGILIPFGSSMQQLETYYATINSAITFAFAIHFWLTRERPWLMILVFGYLIATSFYSYFSTWKDPIFILITTILVSYAAFRIKQAIALLPLFIPTVILIFIWQTVKGEYREFLSSGQNTQAVIVNRADALNAFAELATTAITEDNIFSESTVNATYRRAGYQEYFNAAVRKVPEEIPHENGTLLRESLTFSLIPRALAPNKGLKNDRAKVERYTDYYFGQHAFASFSLGHYCEAYIDWGPQWMMVHLLLFGLFGAFVIRLVYQRYQSNINPIFFLGILWATILPWGTFQQDMVTVSGKLVWGTVCHLILFTPLYRYVNSAIVNPHALQQP